MGGSKSGCDDEGGGWLEEVCASMGEAGCVILSGREDDLLDIAADWVDPAYMLLVEPRSNPPFFTLD